MSPAADLIAAAAITAAAAMETYKIEYRDTADRWHRRRGSYDLASQAIAAAADLDRWRIIDADGNEVANTAACFRRSEITCRGSRETA